MSKDTEWLRSMSDIAIKVATSNNYSDSDIAELETRYSILELQMKMN